MMTAIEPNVNLTGLYPVGQASALLGIHRNTLRRYADEGRIKCKYRRDTGTKVFEGRELLRFWKATL